MKIRIQINTLLALAFLIYNFGYANLSQHPPKKRFSNTFTKNKAIKSIVDHAPILTA